MGLLNDYFDKMLAAQKLPRSAKKDEDDELFDDPLKDDPLSVGPYSTDGTPSARLPISEETRAKGATPPEKESKYDKHGNIKPEHTNAAVGFGDAKPFGQNSTLGHRRSLESDAGRLARSSRRLERKGYRHQAGQLLMASEYAKLNRPGILTEEQRERLSAKQDEANQLADREQKLQVGLMDAYEEWLERMKKDGFGVQAPDVPAV